MNKKYNFEQYTKERYKRAKHILENKEKLLPYKAFIDSAIMFALQVTMFLLICLYSYNHYGIFNPLPENFWLSHWYLIYAILGCNFMICYHQRSTFYNIKKDHLGLRFGVKNE